MDTSCVPHRQPDCRSFAQVGRDRPAARAPGYGMSIASPSSLPSFIEPPLGMALPSFIEPSLGTVSPSLIEPPPWSIICIEPEPGVVNPGTSRGAAADRDGEREQDGRGSPGGGTAPGQRLLQRDQRGDERHPGEAHDAEREQRRHQRPAAAHAPRAVPRAHLKAPPGRRARRRAGIRAGCGTSSGRRP